MKLDRPEIDKNRNRPQLSSRILATLMCIASLISSPPLLSEELSIGPGSAVDAQGVRHHWSNHGGKNPPWIDDAIKKVAPQYPYEARSRHQTGSGLFSDHSKPEHWFRHESYSDQINRVPRQSSVGVPRTGSCCWKRTCAVALEAGQMERDRSSHHVYDRPSASASTGRDSDSASAMTGLHLTPM